LILIKLDSRWSLPRTMMRGGNDSIERGDMTRAEIEQKKKGEKQ